MDIREIINELEYYDGTFPHKVLKEAVASKGQIIPTLLNILEESTANIQELLEQEDYMAHIYAMFLLAQFREERAYPLIVNFFSTPGDVSLEVTGDVVTEYLHRILASVCGGDDSLIKQLAENEAADEFVRGAALEALVCLTATGEKSREEVLEYYKGLLQGNLTKQSSFFCAEIVSAATDLYPEEIYDEIKQVFENGLVDESIIDLKFVDRQLKLGKEQVLAKLQEGRYRPIEDTIRELEWWACFQPPRQQQTVKKKKLGRNEPCPCGSGKKYKKCCGA
ncbi:MAG TPA: DUF1186 domain-containing protein [Thermodesulfobacteriota bacterium]|nr:DUF1186 domain-containing protein [Thermodesulfobacteriota bacterium]